MKSDWRDASLLLQHLAEAIRFTISFLNQVNIRVHSKLPSQKMLGFYNSLYLEKFSNK